MFSVTLPDGTLLTDIPDGTTKEQIRAKLAASGYDVSKLDQPAQQAPTPSVAPTIGVPEDQKEYAGFFGSMGEAATTLGLQDEFNAYMANPTKENRDKFVAAGESKYKSAEFGGDKSLAENWEAFKQTAGSSLGFMAPAWGAGRAGSLVGGSVAGPWGAVAGAGVGMYGTLADEYAIQTALRKAQAQAAQEAAGEEVTPLSVTKVLTAAAAETGLDAIGFRFFKGLGKMMPGKPGGILTKLSEEEGVDVIKEAIKNGTYSVAGGLVKGAGKGVLFEAPQEALQSAFERYGADLSVSPFDPEAWKEYKQSMIGGGILGGPMGLVDTGLKTRAAKQSIRNEEEVAKDKALQDVEEKGTREEKIKATTERLIRRGVPENLATILAAEQHAEEVQDESTTSDTGVATSGVDSGRDGAGVQVSGGETTGERAVSQAAESESGGVGVSGGSAEPARGTEGGVPSTLSTDPMQVVLDTIKAGGNRNDINKAVQALYPDAPPSIVINGISAIIKHLVANKVIKAPLWSSANDPRSRYELIEELPQAEVTETTETEVPQTITTESEDTQADYAQRQRMADARRAEQEFGPSEEDRELTQEDIDSLRASQKAGETPAAPEAPAPAELTEEDFTDLMKRTTVPEEKAPTDLTEEEFADLMKRTTVPEEKAPEWKELTGGKWGFTEAYGKEGEAERQAAADFEADTQGGDFASFEKEITPKVEEAPSVSEAPARDITDPDMAMSMRKALAKGQVAELSRTHPEFEGVDVPEKAITTASNKIAQAAARGERLDPVATLHDAITAAGEKTKTARGKAAPKVPEVAEGQEGLFTKEDLAPINKDAQAKVLADIADYRRKTFPLRKQLLDTAQFLHNAKQLTAAELRAMFAELNHVRPDFDKVKKALADAQERGEETEFDAEREKSEEVQTVEDEENIDYESGRSDAGYSDTGEPTTLTGRDLKFRRVEEGAAAVGVSSQTANKAISEATSGWKNKPRIVFEKATDRVTKGWYDPKTNTIHLVLENHSNAAELVATLFHEALGHYGLTSKFGAGLDKVLTAIYNTNSAVRYAADAWLKDNPDADGAENKQARAVEEVLARQSEAGPIKDVGIRAAFNKVVAYIREFLRNNLGAVTTYTDNDVAHILRQAHQRAMLGGAKEIARVNGIRYAKKIRAQERTIEEAEHKYQASDAPNEISILNSVGDMIKGHDDVAPSLFEAMIDTATSKAARQILAQRTGSAIRDYMVRKLPELADRLDSIFKLDAAFSNATARFVRSFSELSRKVERFINTNGKTTIGKVIAFARLHQINAASWKADITLDEAIRSDDILKQYEDLQKKSKDVNKVVEYGQKIIKRKAQIKQVHEQWTALGEQDGGQAMYKELMQFFKDMYMLQRKLLNDDIDRLNISDDDKTKLKTLAKKMDEEEVDDDGIVYKNFVESYFPWKRFGDFWLAIKSGPYGTEFYTDTAEWKLNFLMRKLKKKYGDKAIFRKGHSLDQLRKEYSGDFSLLNDMIKILDDAKTSGSTDIKSVKDDVVQLWLSTLGERSLRKKMMHSQDITGFSTDITRVLNDAMVGYSRQIPKLMYGTQINNELSAAADLIKAAGDEKVLDPVIVDKLNAALGVIKKRVNTHLNPPAVGRLAKVGRFFSNLTHTVLLSSGATAALQFANVGIRVMPRINRLYGYGKASKALAKYLKVYDSIGVVKRDSDNTIILPGEEEFTWDEPSVGIGPSSLIKNNPVLQKLFNIGVDREAFSGGHSSSIHLDMETKNKVGRATDTAIKVTMSLYSAADRISREITYMMFAELEYNKLMADKNWVRAQKAKNLNPSEEAIKLAADKAVEETGNTQGRYSTIERPNIMQGELGRLVFQFKMFAVNQWKFMLKAARELCQGQWDVLHEIGGVLLMTGVILGGITNLPFYSLITGLLDMLGFGDGDEPEERDPEATLVQNDADGYFRYRWLDKHFGDNKVTIGDKEYTMSYVLQHGLLPTVTGWGIGPRVSLDNLWWREPQFSPTLTGTIANALATNLGPAISYNTTVLRGIQDISDGNILEGTTKLAPAPLKAALNAYKLGIQGAVTSGGDELLQGELSSFAKLGAGIGFNPTEVADAQYRRNRWYRGAQKYDAEKGSILNENNRLRYDPNATEEDWAEWGKHLDKFNKRYPAPGYAIDYSTVQSSEKAFDDRKYSQTYGVPMSAEQMEYNMWFINGRPLTKKPQ